LNGFDFYYDALMGMALLYIAIGFVDGLAFLCKDERVRTER
jgi:hypothetical protein